MSVLLQTTLSGTVIYEYAATSINFNRQVININGIMTPVFTASIQYSKMGYLTDSNGNKTAIVSDNVNNMMPQNPIDVGNIYLDATKIASLFSGMPTANMAIGDVIANLADSLIHADLVARNILT